jgi:hypothetical protein
MIFFGCNARKDFIEVFIRLDAKLPSGLFEPLGLRFVSQL